MARSCCNSFRAVSVSVCWTHVLETECWTCVQHREGRRRIWQRLSKARARASRPSTAPGPRCGAWRRSARPTASGRSGAWPLTPGTSATKPPAAESHAPKWQRLLPLRSRLLRSSTSRSRGLPRPRKPFKGPSQSTTRIAFAVPSGSGRRWSPRAAGGPSQGCRRRSERGISLVL